MRLHPLSRGYGTPTTRRFPRSLAQAFPQDAANPIEHCPAPLRMEAIASVLLAVAIGVGLAASLCIWWST
jgi:hypothetical protein